MDKEFIAMRKKGLVYDYGLQKWVKEPVGMYGDPALAQLFRPTKRAADWRVRRGLKAKFRNPPTAHANR